MPSSRRSGSSSRSRFRASRTAEVATATMRGPRPFGEYRAKKRCTARSVSVDRLAGQGAGRAAAQTSGHSLLDEHPIADVGGDPGEQEANGRRAQIDDRDQVRRQTASALRCVA